MVFRQGESLGLVNKFLRYYVANSFYTNICKWTKANRH